MGRLQDFPSVTPTSSDKILIVQSQGQGLAPYSIKMDSTNPTGTGSLSMNRKANTTVGDRSVTFGYDCTASGIRAVAEGSNSIASGNYSHSEGVGSESSGTYSHAEGQSTTASGNHSHTEGYSTTASGARSHAEGHETTASGNYGHAEGYQTTAGIEAHAEGNGTTASGMRSHTEGRATIANHRSQHVFGEFNTADTSTAQSDARGNYVEIVGNGANESNRSNARTLDWSGNEVLAGGLQINGNQDVGLAPFGYNANTDRNTESVRQDAIRYLRTNYFTKGGSTAVVRYSGGYYNTYIFGGKVSFGEVYIEFCHNLASGEKIIYWTYTSNNDTFIKNFNIS